MLTLQKKISYEGDLKKTPVKNLNLEFNIPLYEYQAVKSGEGNIFIERTLVSTQHVAVTKEFASTEYQLRLPDYCIAGKQENTMGLFKSYLNQPDNTLDDFTMNIDVHYFVDNKNKIGEQSFEAILCIKLAYAQVQSLARLVEINQVEASGYNLAKMMFLINKHAYSHLLKKLSPLAISKQVLSSSSRYEKLPFSQDQYLLKIISLLADISGKQPVLSKESSNSEDIINLLARVYNKPSAVLDMIKKDFNDLFEFTLTVPDVTTIDVSGTFTVRTSDGSAISKQDLSNYDLSVEYAFKNNSEEGNSPECIHFDFSNSDNIQNNTIPFSFAETAKIIRNGIAGSLSVTVKGFDGSVLYLNEFTPDDPALNKIPIIVPMMSPVTLNPSDSKGYVDKNKKLRGQVVVFNKRCSLKDITVVIQAKGDGDNFWRIVGASSTDNAGNFSMPYPYGKYIEAEAIVSLTPDSPVEIPIINGEQSNQTISDTFLYLLIKEAACVSEDSEGSCGCQDSKTSRLPDHSDLIESGEYSQDLGGSCVNLSTPNRTLSEYNYQAVVRTSDPDVANYTLSKSDKYEGGNYIETVYTLTGGAAKLKRSPVDLTNPIQWQDAPDDKKNLTLYQAVTIATGHILHYKSLFKADGYSLGDLIYSLALAPGQKKEVVVLDSTHSLRGAESQTISQGERLAANILDDREITDQLSGGINESLRGSSSANTSGISAGFGIGAIIGPVGAVLGVSGGVANSNSSASQDSSRSISQFFGEKLRQSIMQNAESYRQLNASVVTTVQEGQQYSATSEVVANHNHCHALTMMYFEVLRHYAIYQELSSVEECVFVPLLMTNFTTQNIAKWRDVLATHLLPIPSNTYLQPFSFIGFGRQHPLLKAFDANDRIRTNYANVDFPSGTYDDEYINFIKGELNLRVNLQRPKTRYDRIKSLPVISKTVTTTTGVDVPGTIKRSIVDAVLAGATGGLSTLITGAPGTNIEYTTEEQQVLVKKAIFDAFMTLDANYEYVPPARCIRITNFNPTSISLGFVNIPISGLDFFYDSIIDKKMWTAYASILGYDDPLKMLDYYFKDRLISEWDDIYYNDIVPIIFDKIVDSIRIEHISTDMTSTMRYKGFERVVRINLNGTTNKKRKDFPIIIKLFSGSSDIAQLKDLVTLTVENVKLFYSTSHYNGILFSGYVGDDLLDGTNLFIPENNDEKRNPRKEDIYIVNKLIEHLNSNLEYYNKVLWYNLDADRRYMLLDGFNIQVFNDFNIPVGYRSLASVVKNELVTITGNSLVFPVAAGYKVSRSYIKESSGEGTENVTLFDHYEPLTPVEPYRISVPSRGVFAEAVLGNCNSCEEIESDRLQDWNRFPNTDEPTSILPVNPPTPTVTDWKAAFKDFATPMINIQNAPAEPAPGTGLAGISELLGKSGIFKDITGLDGNQQNVIKTYLSNQENAKAFAEMAKSMAMQSHNTENSDKIMSSLNEAKKSGAISQDDYGKLVKEHLQQQIDGGESKKAELEREKAAKPTLTDAAVKAVEQGKEVKAQKLDPEGNTESIEISGSNATSVLAKVTGIVPKLKQENAMACWATAATMMVCWKAGQSLTVQDVLSKAGSQFLTKFINKEGLLASEKQDFLDKLNMTGEAPANYSLQQYIDWLITYGPLWITTDAASAEDVFSPHARILTKIIGTGTSDGIGTDFIFNDPATGTEKQEAFTTFINAFEQVIEENKGTPFIQVVHFKDKIVQPSGEGAQLVLTEEQKIANLKADNKLDFNSKKAYLEYLANKSFSDALQATYTLSRITTSAKDSSGKEVTTQTGFETIKDLLDRSTTVEAEKEAYKIVDDKGVSRWLNVIYNENLPVDLSDIEKAETASFFANQMEINRSEIQTDFTKTGAEDRLTLGSFPKTAEVKENAKSIVHTCIKYDVGNKKHIAYCLATANGESKFLPVMEGSTNQNVFTYNETYAKYYYSSEGKQSYNTGSVAAGQIQLSDYLIDKLQSLKYIKVNDLAKRDFAKGDNIDDDNFTKLNTLLTTSLSTKDAANKWTDIAKNKTQTNALFAEMAAIMNSEKPAKKVITDDLLKNADFYRYAGKGFIQTTGKTSYNSILSIIKNEIPGFTINLVNEPEKLLIAENAIYALVLGLKNGAYGNRKKLSDYLKDGVASSDADWENARKLVNNEDRKEMFAQCAKIYADIVFRLRA